MMSSVFPFVSDEFIAFNAFNLLPRGLVGNLVGDNFLFFRGRPFSESLGECRKSLSFFRFLGIIT